LRQYFDRRAEQKFRRGARRADIAVAHVASMTAAVQPDRIML